jgi:hypothetical protein
MDQGVVEDASAGRVKGGVLQGAGEEEKKVGEREGGLSTELAQEMQKAREVRDEYLGFSPDGITCTGREDFSREGLGRRRS